MIANKKTKTAEQVLTNIEIVTFPICYSDDQTKVFKVRNIADECHFLAENVCVNWSIFKRLDNNKLLSDTIDILVLQFISFTVQNW